MAVLDGDEAGEAVEGALRHGVGESPPALAGRRRWIVGGHVRRDVDDGAAAAVEHPRKDELHEEERRHRVGLELGRDHLDGRVLEPAHAAGARVHGVVDENVDAAPLAEDARDRAGQ